MSTFNATTDTVALAVGSSSSSVALPVPPTGGYPWGSTVRLVNDGTDAVYVALGGSTVTATIPLAGTPANGIPILPNVTLTLSLDDNRYLAAITTAAANMLYATVGITQA